MEFENRNTLVNLSNTLAKQFGLDPFHNTIPQIEKLVKGHKKVVVLLFDGMGTYIQDTHKDLMPFIYSHKVHQIDSTFPPTTVAATTAFLTGKYPIETGWMSWTQYLAQYKDNVDVFRNRYSFSHEVIREGKLVLEDICPKKDIKDLINLKRGQKVAFDMNDVYGTYHGPENLTLSRWKLSRFIKNKEELYLYYYYEKLDTAIHTSGVYGKETKKKIKGIERFVKKITKKHPDTLFVVIADHGLIDCKDIDIAQFPDLLSCLSEARPISFEPRCPTFWVKENKKVEFEQLFKKHYGAHFDLFTKDEVLQKNIFGEGIISVTALDFIGDYLAISRDEYRLKDSRLVNKFYPPASHGGGTKEENDINVAMFNY